MDYTNIFVGGNNMKTDNSIKLENLKEKAVRFDAGKSYEIEECAIYKDNGKVSKTKISYSFQNEIESELLPSHSITLRNEIITFTLSGTSKYYLPYSHEDYIFLIEEIGLEYVNLFDFSIPLKFNTYPCDRKLRGKWFNLLKESWYNNSERISRISNIVAKDIGISELDPNFIKYCQEIPFGGLKKFGKRFYPWLYVYEISARISDSGNHIDEDDLKFFVGSYDYDDTFILFTTNEGKTYITSDTLIAKDELNKAGYNRVFMPIPLKRSKEWKKAQVAFSNLDWLLNDYC